MSTRRRISVVVPVHQARSRLPEVRRVLAWSSRTVELIIVINNNELAEVTRTENAVEKVVVSKRVGRGFAFIKGIAQAQGDIVLLLHSDTLLPKEWDAAIENPLKNDRVVGGGFSPAFDSDSLDLKHHTDVADVRFRLTGEMMGDRTIFVRSEILSKCLRVMDVTLFEDIRLSRRMRTYGATTLLKEHVVASADSFCKKSDVTVPLAHRAKSPLVRTRRRFGEDFQVLLFSAMNTQLFANFP